ncbi:MAG TPA: T9SS type A sorting domain-containing protein [Prolixibacteraceae bacterium]|nr:T9SS type A sorting domain-containing protein [Prolixibacteraceae bacterium]
MKKSLRYLLSLCCLILAMGLATAQNNLTHSFSFKDGTPTDDVTGASAELMGDAQILGTDLVLPGGESYLDLSQMGIEINTYSELSLEVWATAEAGMNTGFTMVCYLGGTSNSLGSQGCFISLARGDDVSRGAISTVNLSAPYSGETGVNGPEYDDGALHYYVMTIDDAILSYYVDGELMGEGDLAAIGNSISALSNDLVFVGKGGYTADPCWIGTVHKFNIYNTILSADEVVNLSIEPNIVPGAASNIPVFEPSISVTNKQIRISLNNTNSTRGIAGLYTLTGQKVRVIDVADHAVMDAEKGIYIVKVTAGKQVFSQKVCVR